MSLNSAYTNVTDTTRADYALSSAAIGNAVIERYMSQKLLTLADKSTVFYKLGNKVKIPTGESKVISFQRWERIAPPRTALTEGVTPTGTSLIVSRVTATAEQWGSFCTLSDVMELTVRYQPFQRAVELLGLQAAETLDREIQKVLLAGLNVYYPNAKTARSSLTAADVIDTPTLRKIRAQLKANGAPGVSGSDNRKKYIGVCDPFSSADMMSDTTFIESAKFQNLEPLTTGEFGEWQGVRWQESNFIPTYKRTAADSDLFANVGLATPTGTTYLTSAAYIAFAIGYNAAGFPCVFPTTTYASINPVTPSSTTEVLKVTCGNATQEYNTGVTPTGTHADSQVPVAFDVYCSTGGSTTAFWRQATNVAPGMIVNICGAVATATNTSTNTYVTYVNSGVDAPPIQPPASVTVHNLFIFGNEWYSVCELEGIKTMLTPTTATAGNELAQRRSVGWKYFSKALITNQNFGIRIESASAND